MRRVHLAVLGASAHERRSVRHCSARGMIFDHFLCLSFIPPGTPSACIGRVSDRGKPTWWLLALGQAHPTPPRNMLPAGTVLLLPAVPLLAQSHSWHCRSRFRADESYLSSLCRRLACGAGAGWDGPLRRDARVAGDDGSEGAPGHRRVQRALPNVALALWRQQGEPCPPVRMMSGGKRHGVGFRGRVEDIFDALCCTFAERDGKAVALYEVSQAHM